MSVVAVVATKGGSGETSLAVLLALAALDAGWSVVGLDLDPQATASTRLPDLFAPLPNPTETTICDRAAGRDLVILDCPPGATPAASVAVDAAEMVVTPTGLGPGDVTALSDLWRWVEP